MLFEGPVLDGAYFQVAKTVDAEGSPILEAGSFRSGLLGVT